MSSWTSTHAMFVFVTVGYYYMAKILDIPYEVTFFLKSIEKLFLEPNSV